MAHSGAAVGRHLRRRLVQREGQWNRHPAAPNMESRGMILHEQAHLFLQVVGEQARLRHRRPVKAGARDLAKGHAGGHVQVLRRDFGAEVRIDHAPRRPCQTARGEGIEILPQHRQPRLVYIHHARQRFLCIDTGGQIVTGDEITQTGHIGSWGGRSSGKSDFPQY